jgi:hypothetical protein
MIEKASIHNVHLPHMWDLLLPSIGTDTRHRQFNVSSEGHAGMKLIKCALEGILYVLHPRIKQY